MLARAKADISPEAAAPARVPSRLTAPSVPLGTGLQGDTQSITSQRSQQHKFKGICVMLWNSDVPVYGMACRPPLDPEACPGTPQESLISTSAKYTSCQVHARQSMNPISEGFRVATRSGFTTKPFPTGRATAQSSSMATCVECFMFLTQCPTQQTHSYIHDMIRTTCAQVGV